MELQEFLQSNNLSLNDQQKEAVQTIDGPCLLLAVPGSGKTTVLVTRLGFMIYGCGISPDNILTLTYTRAATFDMKKRYISLFGNDEEKTPEFRTINGVCAKILINYGKKIGRDLFDIEEEGQRTKRIAKVFQKCTESFPSESEVQEVASLITYIKNMMLDDNEIKEMGQLCDFPIKAIYDAYNKSMVEEKVIDYDDQMIYAYRILKSDSEMLEDYQNQYRYICVDEAQDTSKIQHMLISLLAGKKGNLFMVGDEDQSIYGFRAAYPEALLSFDKDHPDAKVLLMEENFRSNANIVYSADAFIQKNRLRHKKSMIPHREAASDIQKISITRRSEQYDYIVKAALEGKEIAVLYRDNESVVPLVDIFNRRGIPFRIRNAELTFFSNKVVLDIVSVMKFIINNSDSESFIRFYFKLNLYLSKPEVMKLVQSAKGGSIVDTGLKMKFENPGTANRFKDFVGNVRRLRNMPPETVLNSIVNSMGYSNYMDKMNIGRSKIDILKSVFRNTKTIEEGLARLDEIKNIINNNQNSSECKTIFSTIHSSKGLEYETVYIIDAIDGIFPEKVYYSTAKLSGEDLAEYEESRRVFYVGITRAKDNLFLFKHSSGSKFVDEVKIVKKVNRSSAELLAKKYFPASKSSKMTYQEMVNELVEGRVVMHRKFGKGVVVGMKLPFVDIQFENSRKSLNIEIMAKNGLLKAL